ncbi:hypothetical protein ACFC58_37670, partial [Kitasatospora purpeofusca]
MPQSHSTTTTSGLTALNRAVVTALSDLRPPPTAAPPPAPGPARPAAASPAGAVPTDGQPVGTQPGTQSVGQPGGRKRRSPAASRP